MRNVIMAAMGFGLMAGMAVAKPHLRDVQQIDGAIFEVGVADIIRKQCPDISARMFRAITFANGLRNKARGLGYSDAEIDAYLDSDADKARLRARAAAFFKARGVDTSDPQSYCALGRAEIQKSSRIGSFLREK